MRQSPRPDSRLAAVQLEDLHAWQSAVRALLYISDEIARRLLTPGEAVRISEETLLAHASEQVVWSDPRMLNLRAEGLHTQYPIKTCALLGDPIVGLRLTTLPDQPSSLPTRLMLLNDPSNGEFLAVIDEDWAHSIRTGAAAAVAVKYLARQGARSVGLVGAGRMARCALLALRVVMTVDETHVTSRRAQTREAFALEMSGQFDVPIRPHTSVDGVLEAADVVIVATTADEPLIQRRHLRRGQFIYSMGADQEVDYAVYRQVDKLVADDWEQLKVKPDVQHMLREGILEERDLYANLADIVAGLRPGRESDSEVILVRSQGLVTQDTAQAFWLYRRAIELEVGVVMQRANDG